MLQRRVVENTKSQLNKLIIYLELITYLLFINLFIDHYYYIIIYLYIKNLLFCVSYTICN